MLPNHIYVILAYPRNGGLALWNKMEVSLVRGQTVATLASVDATRQCQSKQEVTSSTKSPGLLEISPKDRQLSLPCKAPIKSVKINI